jgi:two-component system, cell cycle sensor histidine kinase and response regulator CckA
MPGLSGEQLSTLILRSRPEVRLILMSGYPFDPHKVPGGDQGRVAFLHKPFTPAMLAETVHRLLGDGSPSDAD